MQIPRLVPGVGYAHLDDLKTLAGAMTPTVIDSAAQLFGVRSRWFEGADDVVYLPFGSNHEPPGECAKQVASAVVGALVGQEALMRGPLCVLTTSTRLNRASSERQWLLPLVIEPTGATIDGPVFRCRVFGGYFDWTRREQRISLKALAWLVWTHLRRVVPLYEVKEAQLIDVASGLAIPSMAFGRSVITSPSLEDFAETAESSCVAKETDELPDVLAYLESSGLSAHWEAALAELRKSVVRDAAPDAGLGETPELASAPQAAPPKRPGKRQAQEANWAVILAAAQAIWAEFSNVTYKEMIGRLKTMPHLRASGLSDSAIHKRLSKIAPPEVRGKSGRKAKKSA